MATRDDFRWFFDEAKVPFTASHLGLVVGKTRFQFDSNGEFTGVTEHIPEPKIVIKRSAQPATTIKKPTPRPAPKKPVPPPLPEELQHALDCDEDGEHEFIQSCLEQWEDKRWLSDLQLEKLGAWRRKGDFG